MLKCNILSLKTCGKFFCSEYYFKKKLIIEYLDIPEKSFAPLAGIADTTSAKMVPIKELDFCEHSPTTSLNENSLTKSWISPVFQPPADMSEAIQMPQEMQIYLIGALSNRYLKEV